MKPNKLLPLFLLCSALALFTDGCQTTGSSTKDNAGKALATVATSVDKVMQGWAYYVTTHGVSAQQEQQVRGMYADYQASMALAKEAYLTLIATGSTVEYNKAKTHLDSVVSSLTTSVNVTTK